VNCERTRNLVGACGVAYSHLDLGGVAWQDTRILKCWVEVQRCVVNSTEFAGGEGGCWEMAKMSPWSCQDSMAGDTAELLNVYVEESCHVDGRNEAKGGGGRMRG